MVYEMTQQTTTFF